MQFEFNGAAHEVADLTRKDARRLAAMRASMYTVKDGVLWQSSSAMFEACEETLRLSGLKEETFAAMNADEENLFLLSLLREYCGGLAGKGSGA